MTTHIVFPSVNWTPFDHLGVVLDARLVGGVWTTVPPKDMPPPAPEPRPEWVQ